MTHCINNSQLWLLVVKAVYSNVSEPLVIPDQQQHVGKTAAMLQKVAPYRCPFSPMLTVLNATTYQWSVYQHHTIRYGTAPRGIFVDHDHHLHFNGYFIGLAVAFSALTLLVWRHSVFSGSARSVQSFLFLHLFQNRIFRDNW